MIVDRCYYIYKKVLLKEYSTVEKLNQKTKTLPYVALRQNKNPSMITTKKKIWLKVLKAWLVIDSIQ